ncbi:MAG: DUF1501 domain-containing protein [Acidobacteria bacterium]|nr:MAG: DUF1501 domain-containing protein [Acidobacteriota bacterium]
MSHRCNKNFWDRREFLFKSGGGISGLALAYLLGRDNLLAAPPVETDACAAKAVGVNPYAPKAPHHKPRATAVISLFMGGGWSQMDTFDPKPALTKYAGEPIDGKVHGDVIVRQGFPGPLMPSPFSFKKYGQSGIEVSEIFPHLAQHVDEIAFLRSVFGRSNDHVQGTYEMQTGQINLGFPSVGSWVTYGLGSVSSSLPAYVVMTDARGGPLGGPNDWSAGFMPAAYQGTLFRSTGDPIVDLKPVAGMTSDDQRARLDALAKLNELDMQKFPGNTELAARISSYELAYRMQGCAPTAVDINSESEATRKLYGLDNKITEPYGRQCLMARRLVEYGVRFVQIFAGGVGNQNTDTWDAHGDIKSNHTQHAAEVDLPTVGLLTDLKARGLLDSTLVIMHSEFGRMPISQRGVGRDHNPGTQTVLMFGAGIEGGQVIGSSDDFGYKAQEQPISYHDLHASVLHLLGLDHTKLTYRFNGRDMRLTDVYGTLIPQITA